MKFKLRGSFTECVIMVLIFYLFLGGLFVIYMNGQEEQTPAYKSWYDFRNKEFTDNLKMMQEEAKPLLRERWQDNLAIPADEFAKHIVTQDKEKQTPTKAEEIKPVKTWKIPDYMRENLQRELDDFNKRFEEKVQAYKKELKTRFKEFKDMPNDVIFYLEGGFFITRSGLQKLQEQLRDKLKQEVKGDDKTTN